MIRALFYALCLIILFPMTQTLANEDTITTNSATQKTDEQKTFEDVLRSATSETAVFSLLDEDILSWEENDTAQFLYFALAEDRVRELALLVEEQKGKRLHINFGENFILVPEITDSFLQKDGFALFLNIVIFVKNKTLLTLRQLSESACLPCVFSCRQRIVQSG